MAKPFPMRCLLIFSIVALCFSSCKTSVKLIGKTNMISNRNIDGSIQYSLLSSYIGGAKKEFKKAREVSIEDAVDKTVKQVPGGEFLMNVKIYQINKKHFAVEGDVWGKPGPASYRGFKVGDKVTWKNKGLGGFGTGTIKALVNDKTCYILQERGGQIELPYTEITKVE